MLLMYTLGFCRSRLFSGQCFALSNDLTVIVAWLISTDLTLNAVMLVRERVDAEKDL